MDMLYERRREKKFREKTRFRWHVYVDVKISSDDEWLFTDDSEFEEGFIQEGGDCDRMFFWIRRSVDDKNSQGKIPSRDRPVWVFKRLKFSRWIALGGMVVAK